jgi:hypothetical protein
MKALLSGAALAGLAYGVFGVGVAVAQNYPWCLIDQGPGGGTTCLYSTIDQCKASAAGGAQVCQKNPAYWWGKPGYEGSPNWRERNQRQR